MTVGFLESITPRKTRKRCWKGSSLESKKIKVFKTE
jgi:hypothetical protein